MNNKSAAGARRSAIAERVRLRAEWAALKGSDTTADVLRGVVALVDVGEGSRALALRAALTALGATVVPNWVPLVTHVIWSAEGNRSIRAKARALACAVLSPLWVEACAASARRLPESAFPAAARPSDLPSPRALRRMLKIAEKENITLDLLGQSGTKKQLPANKEKLQKLRISSETEIDTSTDKSTDLSTDKSANKSSLPSRVNTAIRRVLPAESPVKQKKSRRKLFTQKEDADGSTCDEEDMDESKPKAQIRVTQRDRRELVRAERMARRLANDSRRTDGQTDRCTVRVVLSGMSSEERKKIFEAVKRLNGKVLKNVTKKTTHVILGTCKEVNGNEVEENGNEMSGVRTLNCTGNEFSNKYGCGFMNNDSLIKARTLNALEGAARGCRVLRPDWVTHSMGRGGWAHPYGYEVPYLKKLAQRARIERTATRQTRADYAYDVFCGLAVRVTEQAEQRAAAVKLLLLCGAKLVDCTPDVVVGIENGQVSSKWVFDSVAAARIRTIRRYIVSTVDTIVEEAVPSTKATQGSEFVSLQYR